MFQEKRRIKRIAPGQNHGLFRDTRGDTDSTVCQQSNPGHVVDQSSEEKSNRGQVDTTEVVSAYPTNLYLSAIAQENARTDPDYDDEQTELATAVPTQIYQRASETTQSHEAAISQEENDQTELASASSIRFYQQALEQESDQTELTSASPARFYQQALEQERALEESDQTELASASPAHFYQQALEQESDQTELATASSVRLYQQAIKKDQTDLAEDSDKTILCTARDLSQISSRAKEQEVSPAPRKLKTASPAPRKPARRRFLNFWRFLIDIVLLLALLSISLATYQQHIEAQNVLLLGQAQVRVNQQQAVINRLNAQKNAAANEVKQAAQIKQEAHTLVQQFDQAANSWGKAHLYRDSFDGHKYSLDSGYEQPGIGSTINQDLASARSTADFEAVVSETQGALFNLQMLEEDYNDHTPYNQPHKSDLSILQHYQLQQKTVITVSMVEQVMRVYQNGKLERAFYVTTGRPERPSLPGVWPVLNRQSPVIFVSADPPGSPYWFPATPINYAILYHLGGFFLHDAPWRLSFGPGTQFPHEDASGNTPYNYDGSHGCINLSESDAAWLYQHTNWNTDIVIY